jgi:lysophospholipase L1-like esterase
VTQRYLALGDSYTIGEAVSASDRWPVQLAAAVRNAGVALGDPVIIAKTGWTTTELIAVLDEASPAPDAGYDLVSLLIGVNDQYRGLGVLAFRDGFLELLSRSVRHARGEPSRVLAVSIPDWAVTPFAVADPRGAATIASEIDQFNALICDEACKAGVRFIDVTPISRRAADNRVLLADDGLHPSSAMYAEWARFILPEALAALQISR